MAGWVAAFLGGIALTSDLRNQFRTQAGLPGTDTQRVDDVLEASFGQKSYAGFTIVVRSRKQTSADLVGPVSEAAAQAAALVPSGRLASVQAITGDTVVATVVSKLDVPDAQDYTDGIRARVAGIPGAQTWVTGNAAIAADTWPVIEDDMRVGELYIAIPIAVAILVYVFGTLAFLIPLLFALMTIPVTLGLVWVAAHWLPMMQTVQNLTTFIGLGIAIDYSLLVVYRYREELRKGDGREEALVRTMKTAGHSVVFSGTAVAIGLAMLLLIPVPGLAAFGVAGLLVPAVSVLCAVTLLPVSLYLLEKPLDRVRLVPRRVLERRESTDETQNVWVRIAHRIMRRPWSGMAAALAILALFATPLAALDLGPGTNEVLPQQLESTQGLRVLSRTVGAGALNPSEIVVDAHRPRGLDDPQLLSATAQLVAELDGDPEVGRVYQDSGPAWFDATGRYLRLQVVGRSDPGSDRADRFVERLREEIIPRVPFPDGTEAIVGGGPAGGVDFIERTYSFFPFLVLAVLALTYVLLMRAFRSLLLPLKAILLNLLSIGAAYGLLVAFFKWGLGEPFGLIEYEQVTAWIPVFLFAMLFGLSMDYEVFLVTRMREEWDRTKDNAKAVELGLAKTGRIVTAAGLIMFAAFMGLVSGSFVELQQFGFGLAAAILVDVTIVRALLLPSAMTLLGRWNWWLPAWMARSVRVEPSPLEPKATPQTPPVVA